MLVRLNKYLSECGIASRRKADEIISEGRVTINGNLVTELGSKVNTDSDEVFLDGERIKEQRKIYFLLNKPKGIITSTKDEKNRRTVTDLINTNEKIFPVGRLDYNTTGLLILTNDGEFTNFFTHPKNGIEREYEVELDNPLSRENREKITKGLILDGRRSRFNKVTFPKRNNFNFVKVTTVEGRNHFVKKMFSLLGYRVKTLNRVRFGELRLDKLRSGEFRQLSKSEIKSLYKN